MLTRPPSHWAVQGATFAVWALAAASALYWGLRIAGGPSAPGVAPVAAWAPPTPDAAAVARLLGAGEQPAASAPQPAVATRLQLVGVATRAERGGESIAIISVDGKPARPFVVGSRVDERYVLQAVQGRRAMLGPSVNEPASLVLELPPTRKQR